MSASTYVRTCSKVAIKKQLDAYREAHHLIPSLQLTSVKTIRESLSAISTSHDFFEKIFLLKRTGTSTVTLYKGYLGFIAAFDELNPNCSSEEQNQYLLKGQDYVLNLFIVLDI